MYGDIYDGLRSYYATFAATRGSAAYQAAATLSLICCINVGSILTLGDQVLNGNLHFSVWFFGNRLALLAIGVGIGWLHVFLGKLAGLYYFTGPPRSPHWKKYVVVYAGLSALIFLAAILVAFENPIN